jgi:outer membrane protein assembly factor BamB
LLPLLLGVAAVAQLPNVPAGPGDWPQWRGPNRDGISPETGLLKEWPEDGPRVVWQIDDGGVGYSSIAVRDGRIYTQGDLDGVEHVIAIDAANGKVLWSVQPEPVARELEVTLTREMERADGNGDGVLDEAEALARFGSQFNQSDRAVDVSREEAQKLAAERADRTFTLLDANRDGRLSFEEAGRMGEDFQRADTADPEADKEMLAARRTAEFLKQLDKNGDGQVARDESRGSALDQSFGRADQRDPATGRGDQQLTQAEIEAYLLSSEAGRDGLLTVDELGAFYAARYPGGDGILSKEELRGYFGGYRNGRGDGPRGTPAVDGDKVYTIGGSGDLTCFDAATGRTLWHKNLTRDLGGRRPGWGYCESPLVVGDLVIVTPGGKEGTVAALEKQTGNVVWRSAGTTQGAHYSTAVIAEIAGVRQIVQFASGSCFGVSLDGGKLLWEYDAANNGTANVCTPIVQGDHVFASSSYGTGGGLVKITHDGDGQKAEEVYFENSMANHHGGIVKVGDYMYGFGNGGLICMNYLTGDVEWKARSVGKGSLVAADGMLYLLGEGKEVALAEATPEEYREHGRFRIDDFGRPSWAHPVVVGGRFYIRNQQRLTAYDVRGK